MRKWTWRKLLIHAAIEPFNPLSFFVHDDFARRCIAGRILHWWGDNR